MQEFPSSNLQTLAAVFSEGIPIHPVGRWRALRRRAAVQRYPAVAGAAFCSPRRRTVRAVAGGRRAGWPWLRLTRIFARRVIFFPFPPLSLQVLEARKVCDRGDGQAVKLILDLADDPGDETIPPPD